MELVSGALDPRGLKSPSPIFKNFNSASSSFFPNCIDHFQSLPAALATAGSDWDWDLCFPVLRPESILMPSWLFTVFNIILANILGVFPYVKGNCWRVSNKDVTWYISEWYKFFLKDPWLQSYQKRVKLLSMERSKKTHSFLVWRINISVLIILCMVILGEMTEEFALHLWDHSIVKHCENVKYGYIFLSPV